jgi:MFS family permease
MREAPPSPDPAHSGDSPRFFYGWVIVGVCFLTQFVATGCVFYALSVLLTPLADEFAGGRRTPILTLHLLMGISGMVIGPLLGRQVGLGYVRAIMTLAALATGAGLLLVATAQALWQIQLVFATLVAFGMGGLTMLTGTPLIASWFETKRALALGVSQLGASLGGAVMAPIVALLVVDLGWRSTFQVLGISILCVAPLAWLLVVQHPEQRGLRPHGAFPDAPGSQPPASPAASRVSAREALRDTNLWLIAVAMGLGILAMGAVLNHIVAFGTDAGFTPSRAALLASLISAGAALGKLVFGYLSDRIGEVNAFTLSCLGFAAGLALLTQLEGYVLVAACGALIGVALGGQLPVSSALMARAFGRDQVGPKMGMAMPITNALQLGGPIATAWVFDTTGSYDVAFWCLVVLLTIAALLVRQVKLPTEASPMPTAKIEPSRA